MLLNECFHLLFSARLRLIHPVPAWQDGRHLKVGKSLPPKLVAQLSTTDRNVTLVLQRNYQIDSNVPVTVERYGKIIRQHINQKEEVGFYHDVKHGCSVMVQRSKGYGDYGQELEFFGTIHVGTKFYLIQPPDKIKDTHSLTEIQRSKFAKDANDHVQTTNRKDFDYLKATDSLDLSDGIAQQARMLHKRATTSYEIEVLMVVDNSVYSFWRNLLSGTPSILKDIKTKSSLRQYYALLLHSANMPYQSVTGRGYEIKLLFAGLHISDTISTSPWTEPLKNVPTTPVSVNSSAALERFSEWINDHENQLPGFDHAMLFTHYELHYYKNRDPVIAGLGYKGDLCGKYRESIVQHAINVYTPNVAAHELGHNLGAEHDGEGNSCLGSDGFVMATPIRYYINDSVNLHFWKFSSCSMDYFDAFIKSLTSQHKNCMAKRSALYNSSALSEYENELNGQIYPPDEQCHFLYGEDSYFRREFYDGDLSSICDKMYCYANISAWWYNIPLDGTACGNGKMCRKGKCITLSDVPTGLSDACPHGDKPGIIPHLNKLCMDIRNTKSLHHHCYDKHYSKQCCKTCAFVSQLYNTTSCEFGDRHPACDVSTCGKYVDYWRNHMCCWSCSKPVIPTISPFMIGCREGNCITTTDAPTGLSDTCPHGDKSGVITYLNKPCMDIRNTRSLHHHCYDKHYSKQCCETCAFVSQLYNTTSCEFGDRHPACNVSTCGKYVDYWRNHMCCWSCTKPVMPIISPFVIG